jgi:hypothetical protein
MSVKGRIKSICGRGRTSNEHAIVSDDGLRPACTVKFWLPVLGWRITIDKEEECIEGHQDTVGRYDKQKKIPHPSLSAEPEDCEGYRVLASKNSQDGKESSEKTVDDILGNILKGKVGDMVAEAEGNIVSGAART